MSVVDGSWAAPIHVGALIHPLQLKMLTTNYTYSGFMFDRNSSKENQPALNVKWKIYINIEEK